eukprot:3369796-Pleurochrysis_carterae.AAC.1
MVCGAPLAAAAGAACQAGTPRHQYGVPVQTWPTTMDSQEPTNQLTNPSSITSCHGQRTAPPSAQ